MKAWLALTVWMALAGVATAQPVDPGAFAAKVEAAAQQMDADLPGALEALQHLSVDSTQLRATRPLTAVERPAHSRLFLLLARGRIQVLDNTKAEEAIRELIRIDPTFSGQLSPREQELFDGLRQRETGLLEILSRERGARIVVDGTEIGVSADAPVRARILSGSYEVRAEKAGFKAASTRITITPGQTVTITDLTPERNVPPLALLTEVDNVEVIADNTSVGRTAKLVALGPLLSPEANAALLRALAAAGLDASTAGGILMRNPPVDRDIALRFRRECYVEETRTVSVTSDLLARLEPQAGIVWLGDAGVLKMRRDLGTLHVTSTPAAADVLVDGQVVGKTPFEQQVCSGSRRVRVRHRVGSFSVALNVTTGRTEVLDVALKPDVAFLGAVEATADGMRPSADLSNMVARSIGSSLRSFRLATPVDLPADAPRWTDRSAAELAIAVDKNDGETLARLAKLATATYDAPFFIAARRASADAASPIDLLLLWNEHADVDRLRIADGSEKTLVATLAEIGGPAEAGAIIYGPDAGIRVADTGLSEAPLLVAAVQKGSPAASAGIKTGDAVQSLDGQSATAAQFAEALRRKQPGEILALKVSSGVEPPRTLQIPVQRRPLRAPAFDTQTAGNAMIARLSAARQIAAAPDRDLFAFNLALVYMRFGEWRRALDLLAPIETLPPGEGVGTGAALYFRARCHEQLGEREKAVSLYKDALSAADEVLGDDGASVSALARYRLSALDLIAPAR